KEGNRHPPPFLNDSAVSAHVVLTRERARVRVEVTLHARRERFLHGEATGQSVELAMSAAADKVDQQARKLKGKRDERKRGPSALKTGSAVEEAAASGPTPGPPRRTIVAANHAI